MKRIVAFALMLVLVLACLAPAIAATTVMSAAAHGGFARSASVTKNRTGNVSGSVNSVSNLDSGLSATLCAVSSSGSLATGYCSVSGTRSFTLYYTTDELRNTTGLSYSLQFAVPSTQTRTVTTNISWAP